MTQQNADMTFIQTATGEIPAAKVLEIGDIVFVDSVDNGTPRARKFTVTYGVDGIVLTKDFLDDNHLVRGRLEHIREAVMAKVRTFNR